MPSLDELKAKYLGARRADTTAEAMDEAGATAEANDTALVEREAGPAEEDDGGFQEQKESDLVAGVAKL